jgi:hypothetical protein
MSNQISEPIELDYNKIDEKFLQDMKMIEQKQKIDINKIGEIYIDMLEKQDKIIRNYAKINECKDMLIMRLNSDISKISITYRELESKYKLLLDSKLDSKQS